MIVKCVGLTPTPLQVYIFKDRVEIVSPGGLPAGMTEANLGIKSIPRNPLLFGTLHRMEVVEHIGSGIRRIRNLCREYGVANPHIDVSETWFTMTFPRTGLQVGIGQEESKIQPTGEVAGEVTGEVAGEVRQLLNILANGPLSRTDAQAALGLKGQANFRDRYLGPALEADLIEMTIPDKPQSRNQRYRLTALGRKTLDQQD